MAKKDGDPYRFLDAAQKGAERAATLTHRLLAFSRRQPLSPHPIDPNRMVAGMAELLHRTLGETVQLETVLGAGLWWAQADPAQLENAILNLAVNARDAMPEGGKLTIETNNAYLDDEYAARHLGVPAGQYVLIAISDTGSGIAPQIVERIFDPFFTTKPIGKGTGLGLSQVYGFVRQSGGHIKVYSELGHGTTVKIYLPRHFGDKTPETPPSLETPAPRGSGGETIVVVEDDDGVRQLAVDSLVELGYKVAAFSSAASALRHISNGAEIDVLFTDVVMPEMNGRQLAEEARKQRPELKVLFTTGYTQNAIVHGGVLDRSVDLIVKPYPVDKLAKKIREILDRGE
jgi:CheY-like chemotaxis protein